MTDANGHGSVPPREMKRLFHRKVGPGYEGE